MAATRAIEIRTEIPGPRSRELLARGQEAVAKPLQVYLPVFVAEALQRHDHRRRRKRLRGFRGRRRRVQRRPRPSPSRGGDPGAGGDVRPHRLHGRAVRGRTSSWQSASARSCPISGADASGVLQLGGGGRRERRQDRAARSRVGPAVIAFEGGFHGRTMLAMTMTSKVHPYKTGMGPFAPEVYRAPVPERVSGPSRRRGARGDRADVRDPRGAVSGSGDRVRAATRRGRLRARAVRVRRKGSAGSAIARASSSSPTRCRPDSAVPAACSRWSTTLWRPT